MKTENTPTASPEPTFLKDYQKPSYLVRHVALEFQLDPIATRVTARLEIRRNEGVREDAPLMLNGEQLDLQEIRLDGEQLAAEAYDLDEKILTISSVPSEFTLETLVIINPEANTALSGLYMSNGMFCTQCEAEGFRRITFYPDRPDVLATFDVRIEADKELAPVLLANGNPGAAGALEGGRHFASWSDPHPKPAYLFALVGGDLSHVEDSFTTKSDRDVTLRVFVQPQNVDKCDYTLDALKRSMKWDEETFGREYDLDIFMIVAVDHFNFGAMENKGLNIFNSAYVLASPQTATDTDYELIEAIVAHEYFHNWSGNRVTCRDWFQLCLKEGFTVFRDQEFSADMRSRAVQRIKDVRQLWARQFPEDAGPLAHPARPESFITIDNFYTATVYEKGAELVRMMRTMLGPQAFRKATDLYFDRHDGEAATVEDFVTCMEDAGGMDLGQFRHWYSDAGTPEVVAEESWDNGTYALTLTQKTLPTPGQSEKPARHIPMRIGLVGPDGEIGGEELVHLKEETQTMTMRGLAARPVPSLFRGFSAPVNVRQNLSVSDRLMLIAHDTDPFNRWAIANRFATDVLRSFAGDCPMDNDEQAAADYAEALAKLLAEETLEPAFKAEVLRVPSETDIARAVKVIDPEAIATARRKFRGLLLDRLDKQLVEIYETHQTPDIYSPAADQAGKRTLKNTSLGLLLAAPETHLPLALNQAAEADNMTDEAAAVSMIALSDREERTNVLASFYDKWQHETLVINKWLSWQAIASIDGALETIRELTAHEAFDLKNPNKVRALIGAFAMENLKTFHAGNGSGYDFFFEHIRALDPINPQVAARLLGAAESWRRLEPARQEKLGAGLEALAQTENLSENVFEMATRLAE